VSNGFVEQIKEYGAWREAVADRVYAFQSWLDRNELLDGLTRSRCERLLARLGEDRLTIAVVGEFSRGKSELVNALFATRGGTRLLPALPGRGTLCPTEFAWDATRPPSISLLPIETRGTDSTLHELKQHPGAWKVVSIEPRNPSDLADALKLSALTIPAAAEDVQRLGLAPTEDDPRHAEFAAGRPIEIPRWRHAAINLPHPLLKLGLTLLDTPGLNALGSEPEMTLDVLPNADVLLFLLDVATGVTRSDIRMWRQYVASAERRRETGLVLVNKVDSLRDALRSEEEVAGHVAQQVTTVSRVLGVDRERVLPVSAKDAVVGKVTGDERRLAASNIVAIEEALGHRLLPSRRTIVRDLVRNEVASVIGSAQRALAQRVAYAEEQISELRTLYTSRSAASDVTVTRARQEKAAFEREFIEFQQFRRVFAERSNELFTLLSPSAMEGRSKLALLSMMGSSFTAGLRRAMRDYFEDLRATMTAASRAIEETQNPLRVMYAKHCPAPGLLNHGMPRLSLQERAQDLERVEGLFRQQFDTLPNLLTTEKSHLTLRFFKTLVKQVGDIWTQTDVDVTRWLQTVIAPLERQFAERRSRLRKRLLITMRLRDATIELDGRATELDEQYHQLSREIDHLSALSEDLSRLLSPNVAAVAETVPEDASGVPPGRRPAAYHHRATT
jgi:hypothetical protein